MNPSDVRMMWMSQYNPERISLEDAATFFGHPSVGLSVMDDSQTAMDLNPMMSIVGGDFNNQAAAAAAAAALGVQPTTLLTAANTVNDIYGLAQVGGLHQQLLQQSAAVFQNYTEMLTNENLIGNSNNGTSLTIDACSLNEQLQQNKQQQQQQLLNAHFAMNANNIIGDEEMNDDEAYDHNSGVVAGAVPGGGSGGGVYDEEGISGLTPKQELINIDDFVMTDSNSYDGSELIPTSDVNDIGHQQCITSDSIMQDNDELILMSGDLNGEIVDNHALNQKLLQQQQQNLINNLQRQIAAAAAASNDTNATMIAGDGGDIEIVGDGVVGCGGIVSCHSRSAQRKTRKIEPISRPGLVLKTPIAYKGNIDPSVIPIQKDGMAVCERCGAIGVKHTFYTKSRRFCSMSCARGELYSLVLNDKIKQTHHHHQQHHQQLSNIENTMDGNSNGSNDGIDSSQLQQHQRQQQTPDVELALRVSHIKNSNYRFRITDQSKITQINDFGDPILSNKTTTTNGELLSDGGVVGGGGNSISTHSLQDGSTTISDILVQSQVPKALKLYGDVMPIEELPQIPKYDSLPPSCPQMEKIISIRRRMYDPTHSFDWTKRLSAADFFAAPVSCFPHSPGYEVWDNLGVDMKVEVENTDCDHTEIIQPGQTPHSFWVATILKICGYKALMRYEGFDDASHDFWVNLCNAEVHGVGWCATRGKPLIPPRTIEHRFKDWKDFLVDRLSGARTLPTSFYNKIHDSMQSRFRLGLNLECVDKDRISQVRLATVTKIIGKRLFLRYFDSDDGFWCHEDSPIIHPVGWATTVGHNLAAPQDYLERMLAGREAMIEVHEDDATIELFKMNFTFEEYYMDGKTNGFIEGMKLEAVDPLNLSSICAATVMAVLKFGYIMIRIDSYQPDASGSDWFCYHEKSPSIFPINFCASNHINLTPPNGYDTNTFNWEEYLQETGSIAAGQHLFHRIVPEHNFQVGMSLECADLMDPRLICVATVSRVVGRLLKIHFDGWTDEYDQWLDCESPDIYPVGWCVLVNHKLEGPPIQQQATMATTKTTTKSKTTRKRKKKGNSTSPSTSAKGNYFADDVVKPRTIALKTNPHLPKLSIKLELKPEHHNPAFYENHQDEDDDEDEDYEDESNSHQSNISNGTIAGATGSMDSLTINAGVTTTHKQTGLTTRAANNTITKKSVSPAPPTIGRKATSYIGNSSVSNSKYIPRLYDSNDTNALSSSSTINNDAATQPDLLPETWNVYDVSQFLRVNDCTAHCDTFSRNKIDGKRLLQSSKDEIIQLLGMKVGPALKIYDLIQQLKCKMNPSKSRLHKANKSFL